MKEGNIVNRDLNAFARRGGGNERYCEQLINSLDSPIIATVTNETTKYCSTIRFRGGEKEKEEIDVRAWCRKSIEGMEQRCSRPV